MNQKHKAMLSIDLRIINNYYSYGVRFAKHFVRPNGHFGSLQKLCRPKEMVLKTWFVWISFCLISIAAHAAVPTIAGVAPSSGTIGGGQTVTITGLNFNTPVATAVKFGGVAATSFVVISDTSISAVTPIHGVGPVSVDVTNASGTNVANALYSYTSGNSTLQISVRVTIPKRPDIQWGNGTSIDDGGIDHTSTPATRISTYTWIVKDGTISPNVDVGTIYMSNDAVNNKTINVSNVSPTNSTNTITATATNTADWTIGAAAGSNIFRLRAQMGAGAMTTLSAVAVTLTNNLVKGTDQALVLEYATPTVITIGAATPELSTIVLTSTAN